MFDQSIEPIDTCGCGAAGYLTTRRIPIDLNHGVGYIDNVPVYHCRSTTCREFTLPPAVSRRLEEIAEQMEKAKSSEAVYSWEFSPKQSLNPLQQTYTQSYLQAFTLQFAHRKYADARVILVEPGEAVFIHSTIDDSEYYLLCYEETSPAEKIWFSFLKFYYDGPELNYQEFIKWSEDGYLKELGRICIDEVEITLIDEFGEWLESSEL